MELTRLPRTSQDLIWLDNHKTSPNGFRETEEFFLFSSTRLNNHKVSPDVLPRTERMCLIESREFLIDFNVTNSIQETKEVFH